MTDTFSDWDFTTGSSLDGADATISAMRFGFSQYSADKLSAIVTFVFGDGSEPFERGFTVGDGWEATDGGQGIVSKDGRPKKLNESSNWGRLSKSALGLFPTQQDAVAAIGSPKRVDGWLGTKWTVGTVANGTMKVKNKDGEEETIELRPFVFTEYHGKAGAGATSTSTATATGTPSTSIDPELFARLVDVAKQSDNHEAFVDAVLEWPEVGGNSAVERLVTMTKPGTVWAEAQKA